MHRRRLLAGLATAGTGLLGACAGGIRSDREPTNPSGKAPGDRTFDDGETPTGTGSESVGTPIARRGTPPSICEAALPRDPEIYAIIDPAFADDWQGVDVPGRYLRGRDGIGDDHTVIGLTNGDRARAYPLTVLFLHEVVNDDFGSPVIVTYCPLCASGMVADAVVDGAPTTFFVSGLLWRPPGVAVDRSIAENRSFGALREGGADAVDRRRNLVLFDDATLSYWSQLLARAICGPQEGSQLTIRPSTVTTWKAWRQAHPNTEVLLPPPHSGTQKPIG